MSVSPLTKTFAKEKESVDRNIERTPGVMNLELPSKPELFYNLSTRISTSAAGTAFVIRAKCSESPVKAENGCRR